MWTAAIVVCGLVSTTAQAQPADRGGPSQFIKTMGDEAISILRSANLPTETRESMFRALLARDFDVNFIGRFVLGQYWRIATPDQQRDYLQAFNEYVLQVYPTWLGDYAGETLSVTSERSAGAKDVLVGTRIDRPSGPPAAVQWRVRASEGELRVIDVFVDSVSLAVTQRDEFASVVQRQKVAGLIELLRARTYTQRAETWQQRPRER
jgi:phospholipid transport system substrate-binding protein